MESLKKYFPELNDLQRAQFEQLGDLYREWNERINVISRKDIDGLYLHHIVHSLALAKWFGSLADNTGILDVGTGGGFPGVPLAIFYPNVKFHLIDRIGKKIKVATEVCNALGLENVTLQHGDVGECRSTFNYVVSRAVMPLNKLLPLIVKNIAPGSSTTNRYSNGLVCLKGGDITSEEEGIKRPVITYPVTEFVNDPFFDEKLIVYVPIKK